MTLYEDLGVPKDATKEEIKRAYRDGSKETHPDAGGDPAAFRQLTVAYKVLSDDEKRARYDKGESAEVLNGAALTEEQEVCGLLAGLLGGLFNQVDVNKQNVVKVMTDALTSGGQSVDVEIRKARAAEEKWKSFLKRLKSSKPDCPLLVAAHNNLAGIQKGIALMEQQKKIGDRAIAFLADYGYDFDAPPASSSMGFYISAQGV